MRFTILAVLILTLAGCAHSINWHDAATISAAIQTQRDPFKNVTTFTGPNCAADPRTDNVSIRAWKMPSGRTEYQVYVADEYTYEIMRSGTGWRFYTDANDSDGLSLPTVIISRNANWCGRYNCAYLEIVGVAVTQDYLNAHTEQGITLKIYGKGGETIVTIPAAYIRAVLQTVR